MNEKEERIPEGADLFEIYSAIDDLGILLTPMQIYDLIAAIIEGRIPHVALVGSGGLLQ